jgi:hypothetical protein
MVCPTDSDAQCGLGRLFDRAAKALRTRLSSEGVCPKEDPAASVSSSSITEKTSPERAECFAAIDSSLMAARLLDHIVPPTRTNWTAFWAPTDAYWDAYPYGKRYVRPLVTFHFAVRLASAVNKFVYLPFAAASCCCFPREAGFLTTGIFHAPTLRSSRRHFSS